MPFSQITPPSPSPTESSAIKKNQIMPLAVAWMDFSSVQSLSHVQLFATP